MGLIAGVLEARGIATVVLSCFEPVMERVGAPRRLALPYPLGFPLGEAGNAPLQREILRAALTLAVREGPAPVVEPFTPT